MIQVKNFDWLLALVGLHVAVSVLAMAHGFPDATDAPDLLTIELPAESASGHAIEELSGIAWDGRSKHLYAVSDRGIVHRFEARFDEGGVIDFASGWSGKLSRNERNTRNAEGLAVRPGRDGAVDLLVALEDPSSLSVYRTDGRVLSGAALPILPLASASLASNDGLEAVAHGPGNTIAYAFEKPVRAGSENVHEIHVAEPGAGTRVLVFPRAAGLDTRVKAIEMLGENDFLVLERNKEGETGNFRNFLSRVTGCSGDKSLECAATPILTGEKSLPDAAIEGTALLDDGTIILAEDRKSSEGPSRFFVLKHRTEGK